MLKFLRTKLSPIGIDLGRSSLKMVQLSWGEDRLHLVAAARAEVPVDIQHATVELYDWYVRMIKDLMVSKPFKGRKAVIGLPASEMLIQHLRVAKMDDQQLKKILPWEAQEKLPFDVRHAMIRHIVAGDVYDGEEPKLEVILMAASRPVVQRHLKLIEQAKLDIENINVEPIALINCFGHLLEQNSDHPNTVMFVDMGRSCTKVIIAHGRQIVFGRTIPIATNSVQHAWSDHPVNRNSDVYDNINASALSPKQSVAVAEPQEHPRKNKVEMDSIVQHLSDQLRGCIRYHDLMFNGHPVRRIIFLGGQSQQTSFCQQLAQGLKLPAQLGDPLARVDSQSRIGPHSDVVPGQANPEWAVAFGLGLDSMEKVRMES